MKPKTKRVVAAFVLHSQSGRRKFEGVLRYMAEHRLDWQLHLARAVEAFSPAFVASFPERRIDGVLFSISAAKEGAAALAKLDIPAAAIDVYDDRLLAGRSRNLVRIIGDDDGVGRAAARSLMSQGRFKSYGFIPDLRRMEWGRRRGSAFMDEIRKNGLRVRRYATASRSYDLPQLAAWIARLPKPAGLFVAYDDRAVQVIEACREAGCVIPDDVAILGVDNDEMIDTHTTPHLSSVQPDHEAMGHLAAARLAAMMDGETLASPESHVIPLKDVILRETTNPTTGSGRLVQRALAFIQAHASEAIKPMHVAAFLKVSRSLADLRFRELQGEALGEAIRRCRLEEVRRQLADTDDSLAIIAARCHFPKLGRLCDSFKAEYGTMPLAYREARKLSSASRAQCS